jgi:hypothetical protein
MNSFLHLRRISRAKWMVVRELVLLWTLSRTTMFQAGNFYLLITLLQSQNHPRHSEVDEQPGGID